MIFGDTRHTAGQPYNVLTGADSNGLFPRPADQLANLASYGDVLQAYCVKTDPICAQGKDVKTHLNYFDVFTDEVADWVKERVKKAGGAAEGTSSTAMASTTKAKVSTTQETTITTTMASETEATTMVVSKTIVSEADDTVSTATGLPSEVVTSLVEAASSAGQAAAAGASSTSTDNAAAPTGAPVVGIMIGVAALLAV